MAITLSGDGISSDAIASLAASKLTGQVPDANAPSGSVIQVVSASTTGNFSTTSYGTPVSTGFSVSITPSFSTSKILLMLTGGNISYNSGTSQPAITIFRNGATNLAGSVVFNLWYNNGSSSNSQAPISVSYVDSPATTSATTYTMYFYNANSSASVSTNGNGLPIIFTAMEIAA